MTHEFSPNDIDKIYIKPGTVLETDNKKVAVLGKGRSAVVHLVEEKPNGQTLDRMDPLIEYDNRSEGAGLDFELRTRSTDSARRYSRRRR